MTIVAGFPGKGATDTGMVFQPELGYVVLAADSEESGSMLKSSVRKIARIERSRWKCLIGGAGDGSFIDFAVQEIERSLGEAPTLTELREGIEKIVTEIHLDRIKPLGDSSREFQLLCALWVAGEGVELIRVGTSFSIIQRAPSTIGVGGYLADYLIATYHVPALSLYHTTRLAVYLLSQVKRYAMFCGGMSQIVWLDQNGRTEELLPGSIMEHEKSNLAVMELGARGILFYVDPRGWGNDEKAVHKAIDSISAGLKANIKYLYPDLRSSPNPAELASIGAALAVPPPKS